MFLCHFYEVGKGEDSSRPMQDIGNPRCFFLLPWSHTVPWSVFPFPAMDQICSASGGSLSRTVSSFCSPPPPPLPSQYSSLVDHGTHSFLLQLTGQHLTQRWPSHKCTPLHAVFFSSSGFAAFLPVGLLQGHSSWNKSSRKFSARD